MPTPRKSLPALAKSNRAAARPAATPAPATKKSAAAAAPRSAATKKSAAVAAPRSAASADPGEAAYTGLQARMTDLPKEQVLQPRADVRAAASHVLSDTVPRLRERSLQARFASLPATEFDHSALRDLEAAAQATLWAQAQLAAAEADQPGARLPVELLTSATALRQTMLEVCGYHFRGEPHLVQQLDDIRAGKGYLDLAEDLRRLASLYRAEHTTLAQDRRFYQAQDAETAQALSQRISSELRPRSTQAAREAVWRAWALLLSLYEEVARGGRFLLRDKGASAFPSLHTAGRTPARRATPQPQPPVPTPAGPDPRDA